MATILIHGGAGTILREAMDSDTERQYRAELTAILTAAQQVLADGGSALDAITVAVRMLEDCPLFNAGRGAVYTAEGKHELDAAVMDGATLGAGAICCATRVRNPVLAARRVMEASEHVLFAGEGADAFAAAQGLDMTLDSDVTSLLRLEVQKVVPEQVSRIQVVRGRGSGLAETRPMQAEEETDDAAEPADPEGQ